VVVVGSERHGAWRDRPCPDQVVWGTRENAEACDLTSPFTLQSNCSSLARLQLLESSSSLLNIQIGSVSGEKASDSWNFLFLFAVYISGGVALNIISAQSAFVLTNFSSQSLHILLRHSC
jgi:hypothetical protein